MKQFCIIQDGIPKVMELLKPAFPLMRELVLEETFLHIELSPGYDERLLFNRKYYLLKWKDGEHKLVGSTDFTEAITEELTKQFNARLARAHRLKTKRSDKLTFNLDVVLDLLSSMHQGICPGAFAHWDIKKSAFDYSKQSTLNSFDFIDLAYSKACNLGIEKEFCEHMDSLPEMLEKDWMIEYKKRHKTKKLKTEADTAPVDTVRNSATEEKETEAWKYNGAQPHTIQEAEPAAEWLPALECAAPEEEYPEEEVEYQPIYVKVKEVEGIKFKSLEFNYSSDEFYPPEEYNAEECSTVIVACIRWKTDVKELVKELNDNGCRSITRELWDGRPPMRLNDEFAKYAEMEYNRGYKVTLVLEEPTEKEQATLLELRSKADKAINKVFGGK